MSGIRDRPGLIHWLASRQFVYLDPPPNEDSDEEDEENFRLPDRLADLSLDENLLHVACNGRTNKVADTCYAWWVGAALANLGLCSSQNQKGDDVSGDIPPSELLLDRAAVRRFLIERMSHRIGGFSKHPGGPPDVYHACFGLTALAVFGEPGLSELDSGLAVPTTTVRVMELAREALLERERRKGKVDLTGEAVELGVAMSGEKPERLGGGR